MGTDPHCFHQEVTFLGVVYMDGIAGEVRPKVNPHKYIYMSKAINTRTTRAGRQHPKRQHTGISLWEHQHLFMWSFFCMFIACKKKISRVLYTCMCYSITQITHRQVGIACMAYITYWYIIYWYNSYVAFNAGYWHKQWGMTYTHHTNYFSISKLIRYIPLCCLQYDIHVLSVNLCITCTTASSILPNWYLHEHSKK